MKTIQSTRTSKPQRRALITGSTGFIGSNLLRHLREGGWDVHALSRKHFPGTSYHLYTGQMGEVTESNC